MWLFVWKACVAVVHYYDACVTIIYTCTSSFDPSSLPPSLPPSPPPSLHLPLPPLRLDSVWNVCPHFSTRLHQRDSLSRSHVLLPLCVPRGKCGGPYLEAVRPENGRQAELQSQHSHLVIYSDTVSKNSIGVPL